MMLSDGKLCSIAEAGCEGTAALTVVSAATQAEGELPERKPCLR